MAQVVVSLTVKRLGDLLISEAKFLYGVSDQIDKIQCQLKRMQCFLEEADNKQIVDKRIQNWVAEMKELAYKAEDVIETYALDVASKQQKSGFLKMLQRFACIIREGARLHKFGNEINTIECELASLTESLRTFGITKGLEEGEPSNSVDLRNHRIFYSHNIEKDFVGMEKEIELLISHLKKENKWCEVISICGMGGQGKTTVATQLYNHGHVQVHFEAFAWVCITQQFDRANVLKSILQQLLPAGRKAEVSSMYDEVMVYELHKVQQEKICLVVIDDIWTMDAWRSLCSAFPIGVTESASKILLTTRNETVAQVGSVYKLPGLTEDEGWKLLSKKAFLLSGESPVKGVLSKMESIGKKMVLRCKGLPLAVATLGGILRGKVLREWEMINRDITFYLDRGEAGVNDEYQGVTHVLGLSYDSLSPRLRQCFLCFSNYKENEIIDAEELYLFWIGEGLISLEDKAEGGTMLEVAERYLDELAHRSIVQVESWEYEGFRWSKFSNCRVHDLIRELCLKKVTEEKVIKIIDLPQKPDHESKVSNNRVRRLCIRSSHVIDKPTVDEDVIPQIRSLLLLSNKHDRHEKIFSHEKYKLLRVLILQGFKLNAESLRSIGKLVYLKYLSFKWCDLKELPYSIGNLRNLEILDLRVRNAGEIRIASIIWKLKQLNHLYLPQTYILELACNLGKVRLDGLNELEAIEGFDSRYCKTQDLIKLSKIKVFEGLIRVDEENPMIIEDTIDLIKSKELCYSALSIGGEGRAISCLALLLECSFLDHLCINARITVLANEYDHTQFSGRLTNIRLKNCEIAEFDPMILLGKLPNLRHLHMGRKSYMGREMVSPATGFPQLQTLSLDRLYNLTKWMVDEGAMPHLSHLQISFCTKLEMLPDELRFLTALKQLTINFMPAAFLDRIQVIDGVEGQDLYKVRHIPTISF